MKPDLLIAHNRNISTTAYWMTEATVKKVAAFDLFFHVAN